jgi:hypothetical protein
MNLLSQLQIRWNRERIGVLMVNSNRQKFFMFAEKFLELCTSEDPFIEVKLRDQKPNKAVGYYPGQVLGSATEADGLCTITFYVSNPHKNIALNNKTRSFDNILTSLKFTFVADELEHFKEVLDIMVRDRSLFDERLRAAEATPLNHEQLRGLFAIPI